MVPPPSLFPSISLPESRSWGSPLSSFSQFQALPLRRVPSFLLPCPVVLGFSVLSSVPSSVLPPWACSSPEFVVSPIPRPRKKGAPLPSAGSLPRCSQPVGRVPLLCVSCSFPLPGPNGLSKFFFFSVPVFLGPFFLPCSPEGWVLWACRLSSK